MTRALLVVLLGFALLVFTVQRLWRGSRRRARARLAASAPVARPAIAGSFVTRDGYEFVVMQGGEVVRVVPPGAGGRDSTLVN